MTNESKKSEVINRYSNSYVRTINHEDWQPGSERQVKNAPSYKRDIAPAKGKLRVSSRGNVLTHGPGSQRVKLGSPEVRAAIARDLRITRLLDRTSAKLGNVIANRIATPKRLNDVAHFEGATTTKSGKRIALSKLAINPTAGMMKTAPRAGGNFPSRYVSRKDIHLSFHDRQEVISVVRSVLAMALTTGAWKGERIEKGSPLFKAFYKGARETLGIHKIMSREMLWDFQGEQSLPVVTELASDTLQESLEAQASDARTLAMGAYFRQCIEATFKAEKSRKAHKCTSLYRSMMATLNLGVQIALGQSTGHLGVSKRAVSFQCDKLKAYIAKGAELLRMEPASLETELTEAISQGRIE